MIIFKHYYQRSDSWMWMYWERHDGFGLCPLLKVNYADHRGVYFYFLFTWWKLQWCWEKSNLHSKE